MRVMRESDITLIDQFAAHQRVRGFSPATIRRRTWTLTQLAQTGEFATVTAEDVEMFLARWDCASTRHALRCDLLNFYRWAVRRGRLEVNPVLDVDPPRVPQRAATPLTHEQLATVIGAARGHARRAVMLGAYAGLRCAEIAALDMADVHRDRAILVVRQGKGGKDAVVPLAAELATVLPLTGPAVKYATSAAVGCAIRRVFRRVGIDARPHDLRHTFGTAAAVRSGGNMVVVASLLRHASIQTSQRYVRWLPDGADVVAGLYDGAA